MILMVSIGSCPQRLVSSRLQQTPPYILPSATQYPSTTHHTRTAFELSTTRYPLFSAHVTAHKRSPVSLISRSWGYSSQILSTNTVYLVSMHHSLPTWTLAVSSQGVNEEGVVRAYMCYLPSKHHFLFLVLGCLELRFGRYCSLSVQRSTAIAVH